MELERDIMNTFLKWKEDPKRKPALVKGARQIGKTWTIEKFGKECFEYYVKFDFDKQPELKSVFDISKSPERIIKELSLYSDVPLLAGRTLIFFDEVQECEAALNSLKYFCEDAPEYHIMAAGSLLGVAVKKRRMAVPVGKVNIIRMYPLSFREFLHSSDSKLYEYVCGIEKIEHLPLIIFNKLSTEYRRYQVSGGMPEPVISLLENEGMAAVEQRQQEILDMYELDFAKYAEATQIPRIHALWHSLPAQLSKENRKFIYKVLRTGTRSKDYEDALMWLEEAGLIYRIFNISKPGMPLKAYQEVDSFKVYACDSGLLRRLANLPASMILNPIDNYTEFKGALAENAVLQSMVPYLDNQLPCYWTSEATAEVEFVIQWHDYIIPIEVKAGENVNGKSLSVYTKKYDPVCRIRFSMQNLQYNEGLLSCPSPLSPWFNQLLSLIPSQSILTNP